MKCPDCGFPNPEPLRTCRLCGEDLPENLPSANNADNGEALEKAAGPEAARARPHRATTPLIDGPVAPALIDEAPPPAKSVEAPKPALDLGDSEAKAGGAPDFPPPDRLEESAPVEPEEVPGLGSIPVPPRPAFEEQEEAVLDFGEARESEPATVPPPADELAEGEAVHEAAEAPGDTAAGPETLPRRARAGFWRRAVGTLVDLLFLAAAWLAASLGLLAATGVLAAVRPQLTAVSDDPAALFQVAGSALLPHLRLLAIAQLLLLAAVILYRPLCHTLWGKTLGKKVLGLRLVTSDDGRIGLGRALARYLALMLSLAPLGLGCLWIAWDRGKQGWHDRLAGTAVIKERA
jgi:uncharacterized RDD family membrane protein YckC